MNNWLTKHDLETEPYKGMIAQKKAEDGDGCLTNEIIKLVGSYGGIKKDVLECFLKARRIRVGTKTIRYFYEMIRKSADAGWFELMLDCLYTKGEQAEMYVEIAKEAFFNSVELEIVKKGYEHSRQPYDFALATTKENEQGLELSSVLTDIRKLLDEMEEAKKSFHDNNKAMEDLLTAQKVEMDNLVRKQKEQQMAETDSVFKNEQAETQGNKPDKSSAKENNDMSVLVQCMTELTKAIRYEVENHNASQVELVKMFAELKEDVKVKKAENVPNTKAQQSEAEQTVSRKKIETPQEEKQMAETEEEQDNSDSKKVRISRSKKREKDRWKAKLFQKVRSERKLSKMTNQQKAEELFMIIRELKYTKTMIAYVRQCIDLNISFEFLFSLVDAGATETEFENLIMFSSPKQQSEEGEADG